jgi:hypothetical protein
MDEKIVFRKFRQLKIITIEELVRLLQCSAITARRRLKKWQTYTSVNKNGRYYTLPQIPVFNENGLWKYQTVLFSKHGNLKQTIVELIRDAKAGLSAVELADIIGFAPNSPFLSQIKDAPGVKREKHKGRFIYLSDSPEVYNRQKHERGSVHRDNEFPTDSEAIVILVQLIKNPDIGIEQLSDKLLMQGKQIVPDSIRKFLTFHGLLKKTLDTKQ